MAFELGQGQALMDGTDALVFVESFIIINNEHTYNITYQFYQMLFYTLLFKMGNLQINTEG